MSNDRRTGPEPEVTIVIPTRDRPDRLSATLDRIDAVLRVNGASERCEIAVVDDASREHPISRLPARLPGGTRVHFGRRSRAAGAAARNDGAAMARGPWLLMLDDDSWPEDTAFLSIAHEASPDLGAIGLDIRLASGGREAGGLPEVFVGCGALVRTGAFRVLGGYDPSFHYYVEEYDFCARLIASGWRIAHDVRSQVTHAKVTAGRDMDAILERLVRNNGWVIARYAPDRVRAGARRRMIDRYAAIAEKEGAAIGFARGLAELERTEAEQRRRPLDPAAWDRFTGRAAVRNELGRREIQAGARAWSPIGTGKGIDVIREEAADLRWTETEPGVAEIHVAGSLSPGPMLDAVESLAETRPGAIGIPAWRPAGYGAVGDDVWAAAHRRAEAG